jgi:hypothetical protein
MGFTNYTALDIFTADDADELMRQSVMRFASTAARDAALTGGVLEQDMIACTTDTGTYWRYRGSGWVGFMSPEISFASLGGGNVVIGNGTFTGTYRWCPSGLHVKWRLLFGTTSDLTGDATWEIPLGALNGSSQTCHGNGVWYDSNADISYNCMVRIPTGSGTATVYHGGAGNSGVVDATNPFTLNASNDIMECDIIVSAG